LVAERGFLGLGVREYERVERVLKQRGHSRQEAHRFFLCFASVEDRFSKQ